jgi:hypothetical protein
MSIAGNVQHPFTALFEPIIDARHPQTSQGSRPVFCLRPAPGQSHNRCIHLQYQQDALHGILDEVGWVQDIILNQRTGPWAGAAPRGPRWGWTHPAGQGVWGSPGAAGGLCAKALLTGGSTVHFFERRSNVGDILATSSGCTLFYTRHPHE